MKAAEYIDKVKMDRKRLRDALRFAETEMRYAGWNEYNIENVGRKEVYDLIVSLVIIEDDSTAKEPVTP